MSEQKTPIGKLLIQIAATIAIIGLILSISRLFLAESERQSIIFWYAYNLTIVSQMTAFLSVIFISVLFIIAGIFLNKSHYDILGYPLIVGSLITLIFISLLAYGLQSAGWAYGVSEWQNAPLAELVLALVIGLEWLSLLIYCWVYQDKPSAVEHDSSSGSSVSQAENNNQTINPS